MARKIKSIKKMLNFDGSYSDILDILGQDDDISDEEIALYANIDIDTVKSIRENGRTKSPIIP